MSRPRLALMVSALAHEPARRGRAERHDDARPYDLDLVVEPQAAGVDLARVGLLVDAPLAARLVLEMLHGVGDVDSRAVDAGRLERAHRAPCRRGRRRGARQDPPGRPAARRPASETHRPDLRRTRSGSRSCRDRSACSRSPPRRAASSARSGSLMRFSRETGEARLRGPLAAILPPHRLNRRAWRAAFPQGARELAFCC